MTFNNPREPNCAVYDIVLKISFSCNQGQTITSGNNPAQINTCMRSFKSAPFLIDED